MLSWLRRKASVLMRNGHLLRGEEIQMKLGERERMSLRMPGNYIRLRLEENILAIRNNSRDRIIASVPLNTMSQWAHGSQHPQKAPLADCSNGALSQWSFSALQPNCSHS